VYTSSWKIPERGIFEFDFVSTVRPESEAEEMDDCEFTEFMKNYVTLENKNDIAGEELREIFLMFDDDGDETIGVEELAQILKSLGQVMSPQDVQKLFDQMDDDGSGNIEFEEFMELWEEILLKVREQDRLITLRRKSSNFFVSAEQIRKMLTFFERPLERVELFVIFFCRLVDEEEMHVALNALSQEERETVQHRCGALNLFNPFEPDGKYTLDLGQHDTRLLAEIIIKLGIGETGKTMRDEFYNGFGFQLPVSWIQSVPRKGIYEVTFVTPQIKAASGSGGGGKEARMTRMGGMGDGFSAAKEAMAELNFRRAVDDDDEEEEEEEEEEEATPAGRAVRRITQRGSIGRGERGSCGSSKEGSPRGTMRGTISGKSRGYKQTFTDKRSASNAGATMSPVALVAKINYDDPNRYKGNMKLRRMVAEELLGWEFKEDAEDEDVNMHEALAKRRSSLFNNQGLGAQELENMLRLQEEEKKRIKEAELAMDQFLEGGKGDKGDKGDKKAPDRNSRKSKWSKIQAETGTELSPRASPREGGRGLEKKDVGEAGGRNGAKRESSRKFRGS